MTEAITPRDRAVLERAWRDSASGTLARIRRLPGNSHRTYECAADRGEPLIARLADPAKSRFALETELLRRIADTGTVPVPAIRHTGIEDGVAVMVQERLPGVALRDYAAECSFRDAHAAVERAGEALAAIHAVTTEGFGPLGPGLRGSHVGLGEWFIDLLAPKVAAARGVDPESGALLDEAFDLVTAHRPALDAAAPGLIHGDFSPANLLVDGTGRLTGVIDWESAKSGPPGMDIGWWDCFFDTPRTPTARLLAGHERHVPLDPARPAALRHLTVIRVMIAHFSWTLTVNDPAGIRTAADRLRAELADSRAWALA
ncbi:MAG: phosphotransferase [Glycomyces artemisiae]|uniref:Phosphotransferase n=1 Tax=Glycomyces artemisiae TaxID=1076443 RepID=A0A850BZ01_9ACTN|nr:phosphotransferase [Glycomyces artemisiae]